MLVAFPAREPERVPTGSGRSLDLLLREMMDGSQELDGRSTLVSAVRKWSQEVKGIDQRAAEMFATRGLLLASFENSASTSAVAAGTAP